jgi:signal recognition particle receptor subunit beta
MAVFDLEQQKIYVRIVYDGAATAGKTTNLRQLCSVFSTARRTELYTPAEVGGRTVLFDWLQINTGLACGFPLVCQVVAVPGQVVLEPRRLHLLRSADAVVFVSSSSRRALSRSRRALAPLLRELGARAHPPPLVLQANKQDLSDSVGPSEVRAALALPEDVPLAAARAIEGVGVLETFVLSVRAIANQLQERATREGLSVAVTPAESAEDVEALLAAEDLPAGWERELDSPELDEGPEIVVGATAAVAIEIQPDPRASTSPPRHTDTVSPDSVSPDTAVADGAAPDTPPGDRATSERAPATTESPTRPRIPTPLPSFATTSHAVLPTVTASAPIAEGAGSRVPGVEAPLPSPNVPTGFIWPASLGRDVIRTLDYATLVRRDDLVNQHGTADGSGKSDTLVCRVGEHCLKTSERRRFAEVEAARAALVRAARSKIQLGEWVLPETVLVLQPDDTSGHWLWTVTPWVPTLRGSMARAIANADEDGLGSALVAFARVAASALQLAARAQLVLDIHPSNFGAHDGRVFYLDDDVETGTTLPSLGFALLTRVDEYAAHPGAVERYVDALVDALVERLTPTELRKLDVERALAEALVRTPQGLDARARVTAAVAARVARP